MGGREWSEGRDRERKSIPSSLCTLQVLPIFITLDETKKSKHEKTLSLFVYPASFILRQQGGGWMKGMAGWMDTSKWEEEERVVFGSLIW